MVRAKRSVSLPASSVASVSAYPAIGEGRLELVGYVGDEVPADGFQPPQLADVADHEQRAAVRQGAAGHEQRAPAPLELVRLGLAAGEQRLHQVARRLLVKQPGQGGEGIVRAVPQQPPGRPIEGDDRPVRIRREHPIGHGFDQRGRLLALAHQLGEALVELLVHGA